MAGLQDDLDSAGLHHGWRGMVFKMGRDGKSTGWMERNGLKDWWRGLVNSMGREDWSKGWVERGQSTGCVESMHGIKDWRGLVY